MELEEYVRFLRDYIDCFAWIYAKMPRLDPKIVVHGLNNLEDVKPIKQNQRRTKPDIMDKIENEV